MVFLLSEDAVDIDALFAMLDGYCEPLLPLDELVGGDAGVGPSREAEAVTPTRNCESEQSSEAPLIATPSSPHRQPSNRRPRAKKRSWDPNKARKEKRAELQFLRQQVAELEAELAEIRAKALRGEQVPCRSRATRRHGPWRDVASMEVRARARAEQENVRMKLVLENQIQVAAKLEALISASVSAQEIHSVLEAGADNRRFIVGRLHCEMFLDLLAGTDASYDEVDSVLEASGLALDAESPCLRSHVHCTGTDGLLLEVVASQLLPFDLQIASDAVWHYFTKSKHSVPDRVYHDGLPKILESTADMNVEFYNWLPRLNSACANFGVKQVLRRFEESERVVFVWRALVDLVEFSGVPTTGIRFLEKGYIVATRSSGRSTSSESVLQSCYVISPLFSGGVTTDTSRPSVGFISKFVLNVTAAGVSRFHQMIESVLAQGSTRLQ